MTNQYDHKVPSAAEPHCADTKPDDASAVTTLPPSPAEYVRSIGRLRTEQQWEVIRELLHPMVMQNLSGQAIADAFHVSVDTAYRWRKRLLADLRREAVTMQPRDFIMESVSSLRLARAEAWSGFQSSGTEKDKRAYLNLILQSENQFLKVGERIGLYGGRGEKPMNAKTYNETADGGNSGRSVDFIRSMMCELLAEDETGKDLSENHETESYEDLLSDLKPVTIEKPSLVTMQEQVSQTLPLDTVRKRQRKNTSV